MLSKYRILLITLLIFQVLLSHSQIWPKYYSHQNTYDYADDLIETYDQGNLLCGNIYIVGSNTTQSSWLIKTDINGDTLWTKVLTNQQEFIRTFTVNQTSNGEYLMGGLSYVNSSTAYPYIIKLDPCLNKVWCKQFATSEDNSSVIDIKSTSSGEVIALVIQFGQGPEETMHLFKLNSNGDVLWKKPFCSGFVHPESAFPMGNKVTITSQGDYLISGRVYWDDPWNPGGAQPIRPMFVLVDSTGFEKWVLPFGLNDTIIGTAKMAIEPKANGEFIATGSDWRTDQIKPFLMKFDQFGNELDYHSEDPENFCTEMIDGAFTRIINIEEKYFLSGLSIFEPDDIFGIIETSIDTNIFSAPLQIYDSLILLDEKDPHDLISSMNNKLMSSSTFKETGNWDIVLSKLNLNLEYDTLDPGNYTYDSLCTTPGLPQSGFIFLDDCDIITGVDIPSPEEYYANLKKIPISAFPNPAKDKITFGLENTEHHKNITLKCFNLLGKQIYETTVITGQKEAATDVSRWPQGMYVAVVYSEGLPVGECKFVVE
jgi:hypothetical protein